MHADRLVGCPGDVHIEGDCAHPPPHVGFPGGGVGHRGLGRVEFGVSLGRDLQGVEVAGAQFAGPVSVAAGRLERRASRRQLRRHDHPRRRARGSGVRRASGRQVADRVALAVWERVSPVAISGSNRRPLPEIPLQSRVIKLQLNCPGDPVSAASHHPIVHKTLPRLLKGISPLQGRNLQSSLIHLRARPRCRPPLLLEQTKFQKLCSRKWLLSPTSHTH